MALENLKLITTSDQRINNLKANNIKDNLAATVADVNYAISKINDIIEEISTIPVSESQDLADVLGLDNNTGGEGIDFINDALTFGGIMSISASSKIFALSFSYGSGTYTQITEDGFDIYGDNSKSSNAIRLQPESLIIQFQNTANTFNGLLTPDTMSATRTWTLPDATGTIALENAITGTFTTVDGKTITVTKGLITNIT